MTWMKALSLASAPVLALASKNQYDKGRRV